MFCSDADGFLLEITHFVTGSVMFLVVFPAFRHLFTPPKTPSFPTGTANLLGVLRVFPPDVLLILEHKIRCFVVISMVFTGKADAPVFLNLQKKKKKKLFYYFSILLWYIN